MTRHQIHQMKSAPRVPEFKDFFSADGEERRRQPLPSESNSSGRRSTLSPTYDCRPRTATRGSESGSSHRHPWSLRVSESSPWWLCALHWMKLAAITEGAMTSCYDWQPRPESKMTVNSLFLLKFSSWEIVSRGKDKRMSYWAAREDLSPSGFFYWHHVMTSVNVSTSHTFVFIKGISFLFRRGFMRLCVVFGVFLSRCLLFNVQRQYLHTSSQTRECVHKHTWHVSSHYTALVCLTWCSCLHDNTCMQTHST